MPDTVLEVEARKCSLCRRKQNLLRCGGCKVVFYCNREHQTEHRPFHKSVCNAVKKAQKLCDVEEQKLRDHPGDAFMAPNPFETAVGYF